MPASSQRRHSPRSGKALTNTREGMASNSVSSSSDVCPLLRKLSEACKKHRIQSHEQTDGILYDRHHPLPEKCLKDLTNLSALLPMVEEAYQSPTESNRGAHVSNISEMCRFYWLLIEGTFCPHSHYLFQWGQDLPAIFSRVQQLYRHLTSKHVIQDTFHAQTRKVTPGEQGTEEASLLPTSSNICTMIAHLLNLIPKRQIQQSIIRDLVTLAFDLATIAEAKLLDEKPSNDESDAIEVVLFSETRNYMTQADDAQEYTVQIASVSELLSLEAGTFAVLATLLEQQKKKRTTDLDSVDTESSGTIVSPSVDCYFFHSFGERDLMSIMITTVEQMLLWRPDMDRTKARSKEDETVLVLVLGNKVAASEMVAMLLHDLERSENVLTGALPELALVISNAVREYLNSVSNLTGERLSTCRNRDVFVRQLSQLVCEVILFPPQIGNDNTVSETLWSIRSQALIPFLDCVPILAETLSKTTNPDIDAVTHKRSEEEAALGTLVLRTIHACIYTPSPTTCAHTSLFVEARNHCLLNGIFPHFCSLLQELSLSNITVGILSKLIRDSGRSSGTGSLHLARACRILWVGHCGEQQENVDNGHPDVQPDVEALDTGDSKSSPSRSGSKRKRKTKSRPESRGVQPEQLRIERSPKRQRSSDDRSVLRSSTNTTPLLSTAVDPIDPEASMGMDGPGSLEPCMLETLHEALQSATHIAANPGRFWSFTSFDRESDRIVDEVDEKSFEFGAVLSVTSVARLLLGVLPSDQIQSSVAMVRDVACLLGYLFQSLKELCVFFLSEHVSNVSFSGRKVSPLKALNLISGLGLHAHFVLNAVPLPSDVKLTESMSEIRSSVDVFSRVALTAWTTSCDTEATKDQAELDTSMEHTTREGCVEKNSKRRFCSELFLDLFAGLVAKNYSRFPTSSSSYSLCAFLDQRCPESSRSAIPRNSSLLISSRNRVFDSKSQVDFLSDCSMLLFEALPQHPTWLMLACLRPVESGDPNCLDLVMTSYSNDSEALDILSCISRVLNPVQQEGTASTESRIGTAMMVLPTLVLSLLCRMTETRTSTYDATRRTTVAHGDDACDERTPGTAMSEIGEVCVPEKLERVTLDLHKLVQFLLHHVTSQFTEPERDQQPLLARAACISLGCLQALLDVTFHSEKLEPESPSMMCAKLRSPAPFIALDFLTYLTSNRVTAQLASPTQGPVNVKINNFLSEIDQSIRLTLLSTRFSESTWRLPPDVRLKMWKCVVWAGLRSNRADFYRNKVDHKEMVEMAHEYASQNRQGHMHTTDKDRDAGDHSGGVLSNSGLPAMMWLIHIAFSDTDTGVRDLTARDLGRVLQTRSSHLLNCLFSSDEEWRSSCQPKPASEKGVLQTKDVAPAVKILFQLLDRFTSQYGHEPQSQLSLTVGDDQDSLATELEKDAYTPFQRSAFFALSSLCQYCDTETAIGIQVFESAFPRLLWFCTSMDSAMRSTELSPASQTFAEISRLNIQRPLGVLIRNKCSHKLLPTVFSLFLKPKSYPPGSESCNATDTDCMAPERRYRRYWLLFSFIRSFLLRKSESVDVDGGSDEMSRLISVSAFIDETLARNVLPELVVQQDYNSLRLAVGFKVFLLGETERINSREEVALTAGDAIHEDRDVLVGDFPQESTLKSQLKVAGVQESIQELDEYTKTFCASSQNLYHILQKLLLHPASDPLEFFVGTVVKKKILLHTLIENVNLRLLKALVSDLGVHSFEGDVESQRRALLKSNVVQALKRAAVLVEKDTTRGATEDVRSSQRSSTPSNIYLCSSDKQDVDSDAVRTVSTWISPNFMFLLVNVVQFKWKIRSFRDKARAMRCLKALLHFLEPSDATKCVPQIMATVNMAMSDDGVGRDDEMKMEHSYLRLLAVQALSHFVRIAAGHQFKSICSDLTPIVVSMFPVLSTQSEHSGEESRFIEEATKSAVSLLEWLTEGELGKNLAPFFKEIPFLPPSPCLDNVRSALKENGVSFDNLLVLSATQSATTQGLSVAGGGGNDDPSARPQFNSYLQAALSKRLDMLTTLLAHENVSVRRVVLRYLTDLLSTNRQLWHRAIENYNDASANRLLTVNVSNSSSDCNVCRMGNVASLVSALLTRCVVEEDVETRTLIATGLGEISAIDPLRIEDVSPATADIHYDDSSWRLSRPPWQSTCTRYELRLVTKQLVIALKASQTSGDQHKIAFSIQQLLVVLDSSTRQNKEGDVGYNNSTSTSKADRGIMNAWLVAALTKEGVLETIEPFWVTNFRQSDINFKRKPPFFRTSTSYFQWVSRWCGFMVERSNDNTESRWRQFFFACRTAIRTADGNCVTEFLFPLFVLDSLCFGTEMDERVVLQEIKDSLTFDDMNIWGLGESSEARATFQMSWRDRQKAATACLAMIDTLEYWAERETEERYKSSKTQKAARMSGRRTYSTENGISGTHWPSDLSIGRIEKLLKEIPLSLRANAAAAIGMNARALQLLEMAGRSSVVDLIFNHPNGPREESRGGRENNRPKPMGGHLVNGIDVRLLRHVLGKLDDSFTMKAVGLDNSQKELLAQINDNIRERIASEDWSGAIQDYERALQLDTTKNFTPILQRGLLKCLLELGHYESILNQVTGIFNPPQASSDAGTIFSNSSSEHLSAIPSAVEAAWRLGRWSVLETLVNEDSASNLDAEGRYQVSVGQAMLALHRKSLGDVVTALNTARNAVMSELSSFARESYSRCYNHLLRLHCLREIENASEILCSDPGFSTAVWKSFSMGSEWDARLDVVSSFGAATIVNTRLALARLAGDAELEGSLYLRVGKNARKSGLYHIAENALAQADAALKRVSSPNGIGSYPGGVGDLLSSVRMQLAKLKHVEGESGSALRMLGQNDVLYFVDHDDTSLRARVAEIESENCQAVGGLQGSDGDNVNRFAVRLLQSTQWMVEGGLKGGAEVVERFRLVQRLCPKLEKASYHFAKHVDSLLECRLAALAHQSANSDEDATRARMLFQDRGCQEYLFLAMKQFGEALKLSSKHVFQALPRLLTLWFDFTSIIGGEVVSHARLASKASDSGGRTRGVEATIDPSDRFYNSQSEVNQLMLTIYKSIPPQSFYTAMPQLISRVVHRDHETVRLVLAILVRVLCKFPSRAMWALAWLRNSVSRERSNIGEKIFKDAQKTFTKSNDKKSSDLLAASKSLFKYFIDLSKYQPKDQTVKTCNIRPWKGEVELMEFVPPVQAALAMSQPDVHKTHSRDAFSSLIPRMRSFCSKVHIMTSKARPKKLKAFAVPAKQLRSSRTAADASARTHQPGDVGEIHFLVKQEAKGDLRKDARVQDLNNVINRLLVTSSRSLGGNASRQRKLLRLRTFSVVCVSEDCGVIEWVPNTNSLRNLVRMSYNPQAAEFSIRRRGDRISNFTDINLKKSFENCQALYKKGDLVGAAAMFEEQCLKPFPPVLYWWFVQNFLDPHSWYEARTRFTTSAAAWSAVGHMIGLGDRHSENILVDTSSGDCVHVDFDCIFDKGLNLPQPEVVPFRLTQNMIDAFGPAGADGIYSASLKTAMTTLRGSRDTLLSVLEPFLKDPVIDWKRKRSQPKGNDSSTSNRETRAAKRSLKVIDGRLKGIYNLRLPASKRIRRTDRKELDDDMSQLLPLSVEGQVHKMITEATNCENLVQIYVGWMPWL